MASLSDLFKMLADQPPTAEAAPAAPAAPAVPAVPAAPTDGMPLSLPDRFKRVALGYIKGSADAGGQYKDYLRASGLHSVCGRRTAIFREHPSLDVGEQRSAGGVMTADIGHQAHAWWQNKYLGPAGVLWGEWVCVRCSPVIEVGGRLTLEPVLIGLMPERCPKCDAPRVIAGQQIVAFNEMLVRDDKLRYGGHPDGLLVIPGYDRRVLFELKTIKTDAFDKLRRPKSEHGVQVSAYMRLTDTTEALVTYIDKGRQCPWRVVAGRFISGEARIKVFHVPFNVDLWAKVEEGIREHWRAVAGESPRRLVRICRTPSCGQARLCVARNVCFSLRDEVSA